MNRDLRDILKHDADNAFQTMEYHIEENDNFHTFEHMIDENTKEEPQLYSDTHNTGDYHNKWAVSRLRRHRELNPLQNFNSKASKAATKEYSKTTKRVGFVDALGAKYGDQAWNDAYLYTDDKGNRAVVLCSDMSKEPYEIRLQVPNGTETDVYVINAHTLYAHNPNISPEEVNSILASLAGQLESGASIEEIMQNFQEYQRSPYPPEIARKVQNQQEINYEIATRVDNLQKSGRYGTCIAEGISAEFDPYMQYFYPEGMNIYITQDNRGASGNMNTEITEDYKANIQYEKGTQNVSEIKIDAMRDYVMGKGFISEYQEKLDIETLMKMGYSRENAQIKLNQVANQLLDGKPIKEVFLDNRQFITEESKKKLHEDMAKRQGQERPDTNKLRRSEYGR